MSGSLFAIAAVVAALGGPVPQQAPVDAQPTKMTDTATTEKKPDITEEERQKLIAELIRSMSEAGNVMDADSPPIGGLRGYDDYGLVRVYSVGLPGSLPPEIKAGLVP